MNIFEAIGLTWVILTAAVGHVALVLFAYRYFKSLFDAAERQMLSEGRLILRGQLEEQRDVSASLQLRRDVEVR